MKDHIIIKLVRAAKERHGGHGVHIYPLHGRSWHDSHEYCASDGWHILQYHLSKTEKTAHAIAYNVLTNKYLVEEEG